ncbi:MAG: hypothetical protein KDK64_03270 [Chlamydiia bacterium]|nr:hypothetical protein [Chlamydiia bacterium]
MKNTLLIPEQRTPHFYLPPHTVTWKQDLSHLKQTFTAVELETFLSLYSLAQTDLKKGKKEVETFLEQHPDHPEILNLLTFIMISQRKIRQSDHLIEENFKKNPHYLFARINYGDLCLRRKTPQKVPELFNHQGSLQEFLPHRKTFHVSEFRGFMVLMGLYSLSVGKREVAECYHYLAHRVDPCHSGTKILEKKLYYIPFYKRLILKLFHT